jgi:hypothetical protein
MLIVTVKGTRKEWFSTLTDPGDYAISQLLFSSHGQVNTNFCITSYFF